MNPTMEDQPPMNQSTMEEDMGLTCTTIPASMLTMTSTPTDDLTPNPTMTPMLHQATPENPDEEELADDDKGTQENNHTDKKNSKKDQESTFLKNRRI